MPCAIASTVATTQLPLSQLATQYFATYITSNRAIDNALEGDNDLKYISPT